MSWKMRITVFCVSFLLGLGYGGGREKKLSLPQPIIRPSLDYIRTTPVNPSRVVDNGTKLRERGV